MPTARGREACAMGAGKPAPIFAKMPNPIITNGIISELMLNPEKQYVITMFGMEANHNKHWKKQNCYNNVMLAVNCLKEAGLSQQILINYVVTKSNIDDLANAYRLFTMFEVGEFIVTIADQAVNGSREDALKFADYQKIYKFIQMHQQSIVPIRFGCKSFQKCDCTEICTQFGNAEGEKKPKAGCLRDIIKAKEQNANQRQKYLSEQDIILHIKKIQKCNSKHVVEPPTTSETTTIFTPKAWKSFQSFFLYGEKHPSNMYEQQAVLIGNRIGNFYVVRFVVPAVLLNRAGNMAISNDMCFQLALDEAEIINENLPQADSIYQDDDFGEVCVLGFAHSHPQDTEFRFSIYDAENQRLYYEKLSGNCITVLVNPQKKLLVCFEGPNSKQSRLVILVNGDGGF